MNFDLQPPSWENDDLNDATTNSSIEIEIEPEGLVRFENLPSGLGTFENLPPESGTFEKRWI
jgi:hypothetical protein